MYRVWACSLSAGDVWGSAGREEEVAVVEKNDKDDGEGQAGSTRPWIPATTIGVG